MHTCELELWQRENIAAQMLQIGKMMEMFFVFYFIYTTHIVNLKSGPENILQFTNWKKVVLLLENNLMFIRRVFHDND